MLIQSWILDSSWTERGPNCKGKLAECIVAAELRQRLGMYPLHYFLGKREIDFQNTIDRSFDRWCIFLFDPQDDGERSCWHHRPWCFSV